MREDDYKKLIASDKKMRDLILASESIDESPVVPGKCFRGNVKCR